MSSSMLFGTLVTLAISSLLNIWFFLDRKATAAKRLQKQLTSPVTLPKGWWSSADRFQAERRAIFSQTWMCVSHRGRFKTPGDYVVYEIAGFRFFMILDKDKIVRSFHNVCRHRAFPVARKQSGSATILGCRYHGWSYDTTGRLTKAPYFDNQPDFDRSQNSLFEIHTKQDRYGFLHINPGTDPKIPNTIPAEGRATGRLVKITPEASQLSSFGLEGNFNWKLLVNDQPGVTDAANPAAALAKLMSTIAPTSTAKLDFYPLTTIHSASNMPFWYQLTYNPISATKTSLRCDVYSVKPFGGVQFEEADKTNLEQELTQKIQELEIEHKKLSSFGYDNTTSDRAQMQLVAAVESHVKQERLRGCEIRPAEVKAQPNSKNTAKAESICAAVECGDKKLDW